MLFSLPATVIYGSVKDEFGNINIASNLVNSLPNNSVWGVCINLLMWASCICSLPVLSVPLLNCWRRTVLMLERHSLFTIRSDWEFVSLKSPSSPSLLISFPSLARLSTFISFLVNWNWILHSTWWLCLCSYINFDSCDHPLLCVQIYYGTETTVDSFRFRVCCLRSDGSSHILLCSSSRKELDKSLNPYL